MGDEEAHRLQDLRNGLVERLRLSADLRSPAVEQAFRVVPRHLFLPGREPEQVYRDEPIVTKRAPDGQPVSSSSQPGIMAVMLEQLDLAPGHRVLEIGTGTGYNAALMAHLVGPWGRVTSLELDEDLAAAAAACLDAAGYPHVVSVCGDGAFGHPEHAPYDRIIATVGVWDLAPAWLAQLAPHGRLVVPLSLRGVQLSVAFAQVGGVLSSVSVHNCGFMRLRGAMAGPETTVALGSTPTIMLHCEHDPGLSAEVLSQALAEPSPERRGRVRISAHDALGGLRFWLALHEPNIAQLTATHTAAAHDTVPTVISLKDQKLTIAIVGNAGFAVLARPQGYRDYGVSFPVAARGFGPEGDQLATRLLEQAHAWDLWDRHERSEKPTPQITAYPAGTEVDTDAVIIDKIHTRLALTWR
jgi:protein-L-isoaspartate(D-aspartate) O-methyltransferase